MKLLVSERDSFRYYLLTFRKLCVKGMVYLDLRVKTPFLVSPLKNLDF